jgi:imidazolonepropionase
MQIFSGIKKLYTFSQAAKKSGRKITADDLTVIHDGVIVEKNGIIHWIGSAKDFAKSKIKGKKIDLKAEAVFPAFVECHTHLIFAGDRQNEFEMRNAGATYQEISASGGGIASTVRATRAASEKVLLNLAQGRVDELLRQGVTTIEVKSGYGLNEKEEIRLLKAIKKLKNARIVATYLGPHSKSPEQPDFANYMSDIVEKTLPQLKKLKLCNRVDIFVEKGFFDIEQAQSYIQKARELGFDLTVHAEQLSSLGAATLFAQNRAISADHLVHVTDADIERLAASETTCVLLPASDFYLKIAYPPARKMIEAGARVALSTDFNPGTSPTLDVSFIGVLARLEMKMSLPEVFSAWTIGASHALNRQNEVGSLEVGKACDFVVSDEDLSQFFYRIGHHPIRQTLINGKKIKKS